MPILACPGTIVLDVCSDGACLRATSHEDTCTCRCGGAGHGLHLRPGQQYARAALQRRYVSPGFTASMLTVDADEAF